MSMVLGIAKATMQRLLPCAGGWAMVLTASLSVAAWAGLAESAMGQFFGPPESGGPWIHWVSESNLQMVPMRPGAPMGEAPAIGANMPPPYGAACPGCGQAEAGTLPPWRPGQRIAAGLRELADPPVRFRGPGQPLLNESWQYRPFSFSWFMGGLVGSTLIEDWVAQDTGFLGGYRMGWDFHPYWGCELRGGFGWLGVYDSERAKAAQEAADDAAGLLPTDPMRHRFDVPRDCDISSLLDISLLYYPWGDSTWRPYFLLGVGAAQIDFQDRLSRPYEANLFEIPWGFGLKFRMNDWLVMRWEVLDNMALDKSPISLLHMVSFTGGLELRFGGARKSYWPWNPGLRYW